jgi:hypothetical protein
LSGECWHHDRPYDRASISIGLVDNGLIRHVVPLAVDAHAVMAIMALSIGIEYRGAVGIGTRLSALEAVDPSWSGFPQRPSSAIP